MRGKKKTSAKVDRVVEEVLPPVPVEKATGLQGRADDMLSEVVKYREAKNRVGVVKTDAHVDAVMIRKTLYEVGAAIIKALEKR